MPFNAPGTDLETAPAPPSGFSAPQTDLLGDENAATATDSQGTAGTTAPLAGSNDGTVLDGTGKAQPKVQSPPSAGLGDVAADNIAKREAMMALTADVWDKATGVGSLAWANQVLDKAKADEEPLIAKELPYPDLRPSQPQDFSKTAGQQLSEDIDTLKEMGRSAAGSAASSVADVLGGGAGVVGDSGPINQTIKNYSDRIADLEKKRMPNLDGLSEQQIAQLPAREDTLNYNEIQELGQKRAILDYLTGKKQASGLNDVEDFRKLASAASKEAQTYFGQDPKRQDEFLNKLGQGAGSLPLYVAAGMSGAPALAMIVGGLQTAQNEYNAAVDAGHPELADKAFENGLYIGMTEGVGVGGGPGKAAQGFAKKVAQFALKGMEEGGQEWVQQTLQNLNANTFTGYNPEQGTLEGSGEAALIGAILGGGVEAIHQSAASPQTKAVAETLTNEANLAQSESPLAAAEAEKYAAELVAKDVLERDARLNRVTEELRASKEASASQQPTPEATEVQATEVPIPQEETPAPAPTSATEPEAALPTTEPAPPESVAPAEGAAVPPVVAEGISSPESVQPTAEINPAAELPEPAQSYAERQGASDVTDEQISEARTILDGALPQDSMAKMAKLAGVNIVDDADSPSIVTDDRGTTINVRKLAENLSKLDGDAKASYVVNSLDEALTHQATRKAVTAPELDGIGKSLTSDERETVERLYGSKMSDSEAAAEAIRLFIQGAKGEPTEAFNLFTQKAKTDPGFRAAVARVLECVKELASNITGGSLSAKLTDGIERTQKVLDEIEKSVAAPVSETIAENEEARSSNQRDKEKSYNEAHERALKLAERIGEEVAKGQPTSVKEAATLAAYRNAASSIEASETHQFNPAFMRKSAARAAGRAAEEQGISLDAPIGDSEMTLSDEQEFDQLSPAEQTERTDLHDKAQIAMRSLSARERDIVQRLTIAGDSSEDIAEDLGISRQAVEKINKQALKKLQQRINEMEVTGVPVESETQESPAPAVAPETETSQPSSRVQPEEEQRTQDTQVQETSEDTTANEDASQTRPQAETQSAEVSDEQPVVEQESASTESTETPPPVEPPTEAPPATDPLEGTTAAYNAATDKLLEENGFEPIAAPARKALGTSWDEALAQTEADPNKGSRLVAELNENPRALKDDVESGVLLKELADRKAEQARAQDALFKAVESGDQEAIADAQQRLSTARDATFEAITAAKATGTAWGRAGRFRQVHVDQDYSLAAMEAAWRSEVNGGKPLTEEQSKTIADLHSRIEAAEKKIAELEEQQSAREAQELFDRVVDEARGERKATKKPGNLSEFLAKQADKARRRIIERRGKLFATVDPLNIAGLADHIIIGADYLAKGIKEFGAWSSKMLEDFGNSIEPALPEVFKRSTEFHDSIQAEMEPKGPPTPEQVLQKAGDFSELDPKLVYDLARAHVNAGVTGMFEVLKAVQKDLLPKLPNATIRDIRDAFSDYGKVIYPSKDEVNVKLREYRALARLTSQLEDAQRGLAPLKTGPQRDKATQKVRELQDRVRETMRAMGIETSTPEQQLKTSLDSIKTRLRNQIDDLNKQIETKQKATAKTPVPYDAEATALKAERDRLSAISDEIFGKVEMTDEQRIKAATKALDRAIAEEDDMLKNGILQRPARQSKTPLTPELEAKRSMLDAMRDLRNELNDAQNPGKSPEQRALEGAMKAAQKSIERYDEMLKSGDLTPEQRQQRFNPTTELETLWSERNALRDAVNELRQENRPRTSPEEQARKTALKALDKRIAELDERIKTGDFSDRAKGQDKAGQFADVASRRAESKALNELYRQLKKAAGPQRTKEEIQLERDKKMIRARTEELQRRVREEDYAPHVKKDPVMDQEKTDLLFENAKAKAEFNKGLFEARQKQRSLGRKVFDTAQEALNTSRAILTSFDLSGLLRQGGFIAFGNPIRAATSVVPMLKAFASEKAAFKVAEDIRTRTNAPLYEQSKLFFSDQDSTSLTKQEEQFMSRIASKIPGVAGSQRAYTTFLNKLRADSFDAMAATLAKNAQVTPVEAKAISNFINVATGRGHIPGKAAQAAAGLNSVFFAPRYVLSRFQLLAGQPLYQGNARTRMLIAREYGKYLIGVGLVYALALAAQGPDDKDLNLDPTSSDFLKVRYGNTRLDPMSGLLQTAVFASREAKALKTFLSGKEQKEKYGSGGDVLGRFLRSKLAPSIGAAVDALSGKDVTGKKVTPQDTLIRSAVPISFGDIGKTIEENGVARGTALSLLSLLGMGLQTYADKKK